MKKFEFALDRYQLDRIAVAVRQKADVIGIWMNALKILSIYDEPDTSQRAGMLTLVVGKMSRVFITSDRGAFSVAFPFTVSSLEGDLAFGSRYYPVIDNKVTSEILSLLGPHDVLNARTVEGFFDPVADISGHNQDTWLLFLDLLLADDGYLRIDHDPENEDGDLHPLDHIDVFYSQRSTFKVGLDRKHTVNEFVDILDIKTDCRYLN